MFFTLHALKTNFGILNKSNDTSSIPPIKLEFRRGETLYKNCSSKQEILRLLLNNNIPPSLADIDLITDFPVTIVVDLDLLIAYPDYNKSINLSMYTSELQYYKLRHRGEIAHKVLRIVDWLYTLNLPYPVMDYAIDNDGYLLARQIDLERFEEIPYNYFDEWLTKISDEETYTQYGDLIIEASEQLMYEDRLDINYFLELVEYRLLNTPQESDLLYLYRTNLSNIDKALDNTDRNHSNILIYKHKETGLITPSPIHDFDCCLMESHFDIDEQDTNLSTLKSKLQLTSNTVQQEELYSTIDRDIQGGILWLLKR